LVAVQHVERGGMRGRPAMVTAVVVAALGALWRWNLASPVSLDYDGVYLVCARLLLHGRRLFIDVFSSQPPLFLDILHGAFRVFGDTLATGRSISVLAAIATCGLTALIAGERVTPWAAPAAATLCGTSLLFLHQARAVQAEMPALAFATASLAIVSHRERARRWGFQLSAGILMGLALSTKLLMAPLVLPMLAAVVDPERERWGASLRSVVATSTGVMAALLCVSAPHGLGNVFAQSVGFHHTARWTPVIAVLEEGPWKLFFAWDGLLVVLALLGLVALRLARSDALPWLGIWLLGVVAFLVLHSPLFPHHLVILIPVLAIAAAGVLTFTWDRRLSLALVAAAVLVKGTGDSRLGFAPAAWAAELMRAPTLDDERAVEAIKNLTSPEDLVATDGQMLAFLAGRDVPAQLGDTSVVRIAAGSLEPKVALAESAGAKIVVLWTGRLDRLPGYLEWLRTHGSPVLLLPSAEAPERGLYLIRPAGPSRRATPPAPP
jgi:hypothetical protein